MSKPEIICINKSKISFFLSFDSAKVQSDYPIDKNKKIRFKSDEP